MVTSFLICVISLAGIAVGLICLVRPIQKIGLGSRKRGVGLVCASLALLVCTALYSGSDVPPARAMGRVSTPVQQGEAQIIDAKPADADHVKSDPIVINQNALLLAEALFEDDLEAALLPDESTLIHPDQALTILGLSIRVNATELSHEYADNEIAADEKYRDKLLVVTGTITGINKDILDSPYLSLRGVDEFRGVQAQLTPDATEQAKTFRKGRVISVVCEGDGMELTVPILHDCDLSDDYVHSQRSKLSDLTSSFLQGEIALPHTVGKTILSGYYVGRSLPPDSTCFTDIHNKSCQADMAKLVTPTFKQNASKFITSFESHIKYIE